ncbi:uncharacterized protein [Antedon mediterranea]|uniref:uncharacterized protein isoform X2 n=1 Tax=Antedon mediterranea TaxID=105859 RepID=UPI003AF80156
MVSICTATVALVTIIWGVDTATAQTDYKNVRTTFEFNLNQVYVTAEPTMVDDEAGFRSSVISHIMKTFNATIEDTKVSPDSRWETIQTSYKLVTNIEETYSLAVRDNMELVIGLGEYVFSYNTIVFKSDTKSLITKESWKETWYEIGHQILYACIVAIVSISIFAIAVYYTCRWGKRRPATEGRYILNETPRTSRVITSGSLYSPEMTSEEAENNLTTTVEMNGHAQSNGGLPEKKDNIEMEGINETSQANGGTENKGFEKEENSMFAKLVYSEYSVPPKFSDEFL